MNLSLYKVVRENLLDQMRQLQGGAKTSFEQAIPPGSPRMQTLTQHDCFVSTTDLFGVTVFARLAHIVAKIDPLLISKCQK